MRPYRAVVIFAAVLALAAIAITAALATNDENRVPDRTIPAFWHEIEEGEATRADIRERLGAPTRVEGSCLFYDDVVDYTAYRFCFRGGVLNLKAAY
jgi:hypothetical protein